MADEQQMSLISDDSKKPWMSKTVWISVIVAASAFVPAVHALIQANLEIFSSLVGAIFMLLRFITKDKISIK